MKKTLIAVFVMCTSSAMGMNVADIRRQQEKSQKTMQKNFEDLQQKTQKKLQNLRAMTQMKSQQAKQNEYLVSQAFVQDRMVMEAQAQEISALNQNLRDVVSKVHAVEESVQRMVVRESQTLLAMMEKAEPFNQFFDRYMDTVAIIKESDWDKNAKIQFCEAILEMGISTGYFDQLDNFQRNLMMHEEMVFLRSVLSSNNLSPSNYPLITGFLDIVPQDKKPYTKAELMDRVIKKYNLDNLSDKEKKALLQEVTKHRENFAQSVANPSASTDKMFYDWYQLMKVAGKQSIVTQLSPDSRTVPNAWRYGIVDDINVMLESWKKKTQCASRFSDYFIEFITSCYSEVMFSISMGERVESNSLPLFSVFADLAGVRQHTFDSDGRVWEALKTRFKKYSSSSSSLSVSGPKQLLNQNLAEESKEPASATQIRPSHSQTLGGAAQIGAPSSTRSDGVSAQGLSYAGRSALPQGAAEMRPGSHMGKGLSQKKGVEQTKLGGVSALNTAPTLQHRFQDSTQRRYVMGEDFDQDVFVVNYVDKNPHLGQFVGLEELFNENFGNTTVRNIDQAVGSIVNILSNNDSLGAIVGIFDGLYDDLMMLNLGYGPEKDVQHCLQQLDYIYGVACGQIKWKGRHFDQAVTQSLFKNQYIVLYDKFNQLIEEFSECAENFLPEIREMYFKAKEKGQLAGVYEALYNQSYASKDLARQIISLKLRNK